VPNLGGRENRLPKHIYLCASWKATLRKELLSERDGNSRSTLVTFADKTSGITIMVNKSTVYVGAQWKSKDERGK
jgi:hypothetical protein